MIVIRCPWLCGVSEGELTEKFMFLSDSGRLGENEAFDMFCPKCGKGIRIEVVGSEYQCYKEEIEKPPDEP